MPAVAVVAQMITLQLAETAAAPAELAAAETEALDFLMLEQQGRPIRAAVAAEADQVPAQVAHRLRAQAALAS